MSVSENDVVTILSGSLKDMEGCVKKIDLHRRIVKVEVDFMNRKMAIHLGIEMVEIIKNNLTILFINSSIILVRKYRKRIDSRKCQIYL